MIRDKGFRDNNTRVYERGEYEGIPYEVLIHDDEADSFAAENPESVKVAYGQHRGTVVLCCYGS
jgi:hypothetical protein